MEESAPLQKSSVSPADRAAQTWWVLKVNTNVTRKRFNEADVDLKLTWFRPDYYTHSPSNGIKVQNVKEFVP